VGSCFVLFIENFTCSDINLSVIHVLIIFSSSYIKYLLAERCPIHKIMWARNKQCFKRTARNTLLLMFPSKMGLQVTTNWWHNPALSQLSSS